MRIYVINLEKDAERRQSASRQLESHGLDFEVFRALTVDQGWQEHFDAYDERRYLINTGRTAAPGEIGCYASHRALWQRCVELNQPIMIMEDDFLLSEDFRSAFRQTERLIATYGFIRLQTERRGKRRFVRRAGDFDLVYYTKMPHSLMCYAISPQVAGTFIARSRRLTAPVDVMIKKIWEHRQRLYGLRPYPVSENEIADQTTIDGRIKPKKCLSIQLQRFLAKIGWAIKRRMFTFGFKPSS